MEDWTGHRVTPSDYFAQKPVKWQEGVVTTDWGEDVAVRIGKFRTLPFYKNELELQEKLDQPELFEPNNEV